MKFCVVVKDTPFIEQSMNELSFCFDTKQEAVDFALKIIDITNYSVEILRLDN